jgi:hypothetical protein
MGGLPLTSIDENYSITLCSNDYILEINGRDKKDDYLNIKHLVLRHEELVDVLIRLIRLFAINV